MTHQRDYGHRARAIQAQHRAPPTPEGTIGTATSICGVLVLLAVLAAVIAEM